METHIARIAHTSLTHIARTDKRLAANWKCCPVRCACRASAGTFASLLSCNRGKTAIDYVWGFIRARHCFECRIANRIPTVHRGTGVTDRAHGWDFGHRCSTEKCWAFKCAPATDETWCILWAIQKKTLSIDWWFGYALAIGLLNICWCKLFKRLMLIVIEIKVKASPQPADYSNIRTSKRTLLLSWPNISQSTHIVNALLNISFHLAFCLSNGKDVVTWL